MRMKPLTISTKHQKPGPFNMKNLFLALILASSLTAPAEAGPLHFLVNVGKAVVRTPGSLVKASVDGTTVAVVGLGLVVLGAEVAVDSAANRIAGN